MAKGSWENHQAYGQSTAEDSQNWLYTNRLRRQKSLSAWIPGLMTLKNTGLMV